MRSPKTRAATSLLAAVLPAGAVIALPAAASAAPRVVIAATCPMYNFTNPYIGIPTEIPRPELSYGSTGPCVVILQTELDQVNNAGLKVDGDFGPLTQRAVENYQGENKPCTGGVDGIAGPLTMSCLRAQDN
jgi:hypothetical protein